MTDEIIISVFVILAALLVYLLIQVAKTKSHLSKNDELLKMTSSELNALSTGAIGIGKHLDSIEKKYKRLNDRLNNNKLSNTNDSRLYKNAIQMVRDGETIDGVMDKCGLVREEAVLLMSLHGNKAIN